MVSMFQVIFSFPSLTNIILESSTFKNNKINKSDGNWTAEQVWKWNKWNRRRNHKQKFFSKAFYLRGGLWILSPCNYVGLANTFLTGHKKIHNVLTKANSHTDPQVSLTKYTSRGMKIRLGILSGSRFSQIYWTIWHS